MGSSLRHDDPSLGAALFDNNDSDDGSSFGADDEEESSLDSQEGLGAAEPNPIEEVKAIAQSETRKMSFWKVFVVLSLLLTGAAVSVSVYVFLDNKQQDEFENQVRACVGRTCLGRLSTTCGKTLTVCFFCPQFCFSFICTPIACAMSPSCTTKLPRIP